MPGKSMCAGQACVAWLLGAGEDIIPIPGTKRRKYLEENVGALQVKLSAEDLRRSKKLRLRERPPPCAIPKP